MKILRSFIVSFVLLSVLSMSILLVSAIGPLIVTIDPISSVKGLSPAYTGTMNFTSGDTTDYFYLKVTIPDDYKIHTGGANTEMGNFTISDKVKIKMISTGTDNIVRFEYSINGGISYTPITGTLNLNQNGITSITYNTNNLTFYKPANEKNRYLEFELGTLGPIKSTKTVIVKMVSGSLTNPTTSQLYTWLATAKVNKNAPQESTGSATVTITNS
ncbi:MAG: hypothetical protein KKG76_03585 [Euryarchaeota archaeon]|nr:hypothetical protein [Euryarchaeota archaeon]